MIDNRSSYPRLVFFSLVTKKHFSEKKKYEFLVLLLTAFDVEKNSAFICMSCCSNGNGKFAFQSSKCPTLCAKFKLIDAANSITTILSPPISVLVINIQKMELQRLCESRIQLV